MADSDVDWTYVQEVELLREVREVYRWLEALTPTPVEPNPIAAPEGLQRLGR